MQKPYDFEICSACFTVYDQEFNCGCDDGFTDGASINWGRYLALNPSLPLIPEIGKCYPLFETLSVSKENLPMCLSLDDDFLGEVYGGKNTTAQAS